MAIVFFVFSVSNLKAANHKVCTEAEAKQALERSHPVPIRGE
jgi:hypothetical protein